MPLINNKSTPSTEVPWVSKDREQRNHSTFEDLWCQHMVLSYQPFIKYMKMSRTNNKPCQEHCVQEYSMCMPVYGCYMLYLQCVHAFSYAWLCMSCVSIHVHICIVLWKSAFWLFTQLLEVTAISITKESTHNTTKGAHCVSMKTKAANNDSALSKEYLKVKQAELKDPVWICLTD